MLRTTTTTITTITTTTTLKMEIEEDEITEVVEEIPDASTFNNNEEKLTLKEIPALVIEQIIGRLISPDLSNLNVADLNVHLKNMRFDQNNVRSLQTMYLGLSNQLHPMQLQRFRFIVGMSIFAVEINERRVTLSLSTLTRNKVRVERMGIQGFVTKPLFLVKPDGTLAATLLTAYNHFTQDRYYHNPTITYESTDHRIDLIWTSNRFNVNEISPSIILERSQIFFYPNSLVYNLAHVQSSELMEILKTIAAARRNYRGLVSQFNSNNFNFYVARAILTAPIQTQFNTLSMKTVVPKRHVQGYDPMYKYWRFAFVNVQSITVYNPPVRWRLVADPNFSPSIRTTLEPLLNKSLTTNMKIEYDIVALALQSDAANDELVNASNSVINFEKLSPFFDPSNPSWPWSLANVRITHTFSEPKAMLQGVNDVLQVHTFKIYFDLK